MKTNHDLSTIPNADQTPKPVAPAVKLLLMACCALLGIVALTGCNGNGAADAATAGSSTPAASLGTAPGQTGAASVAFREGDMVKITFDATTNMNTVVKVQIDGNITLPLVGDVKANGKTASELRTDLMKAYSTLLKGEEITVALAAASSSFYISGAVLRPGRFSMDRPMTVMEAVMEAGGFDLNRAKPSAVTVFRIEDGKQKSYRIDMKKVLQGRQQDLFYVKPFDTIHVPEKTFNF